MRNPYIVRGRTHGTITPTRLPPGMISVGAQQKMRLASCEEMRCPRLLEGWTEAPGGPFRGHIWCSACHVPASPKGCDCERMLTGHPVLIPGIHHEPGERCTIPHKTRDDRFDPIYNVQMKGDTEARPCTASEFEDRLHIGMDTVIRVRTRGL